MRLVLIVVVLVAGCEREPVDAICPAIGAGGLVISEVRGDQDPDDTLGHWVELYNGSGGALDVIGLHVRLRKIDGSADDLILIRRSVTVGNGEYVVIGLGPDDMRPADVDYAAGTDAAEVMFDIGAIDVDGCDDVAADQIIYQGLPSTGTYSFGLTPPTSLGNDEDADWCTNPTPGGTPGAANPPCP